MLYGDVVKSNISKQIAEELKENWDSFKKALCNLESVLKELRIDVGRFSGSWNVLLPIIYYIYFNPSDYTRNTDAIRAYLMRAILFTYFQSGTTSKLQQMKSNINSFDYEITIEMLDQISDLRITDGKIEDILNAEKGSRVAGMPYTISPVIGRAEATNTSRTIFIPMTALTAASRSQSPWRIGKGGEHSATDSQTSNCWKDAAMAVRAI